MNSGIDEKIKTVNPRAQYKRCVKLTTQKAFIVTRLFDLQMPNLLSRTFQFTQIIKPQGLKRCFPCMLIMPPLNKNVSYQERPHGGQFSPDSF